MSQDYGILPIIGAVAAIIPAAISGGVSLAASIKAKRASLEGLQKQLATAQSKMMSAKTTSDIMKFSGEVNSLRAQIANLEAELAAANTPQFQPATTTNYTPYVLGGTALLGLVVVGILATRR